MYNATGAHHPENCSAAVHVYNSSMHNMYAILSYQYNMYFEVYYNMICMYL